MSIHSAREIEKTTAIAAALLRLAGPVVVTRTGVIAISVVDLAMVSYVSTLEVGELALAQQGLMFLIYTGLGLVMGTLVLGAQAYGAGKYEDMGPIWRRSLPYAGLLGLLGFLLCLPSALFFSFIGADPQLIDGGSRVLIAYGVGVPAQLIGFSCGFFLESMNRPAWVSISMVIGNALNIALNALLIFGLWGVPQMGAEGAAIATTIVRFAIAAILVWRIWTLRDQDRFQIRIPVKTRWKDWAEQRKIGYGAGASLGAEVAGFSILGMMAAGLGAAEMAGYGLLFQVQSVFFMLASGLGTATTVRVGMAYRPDDKSGAFKVAQVGAGLICLIMLAVAVLFWTIPESIIRIFNGTPALLALVVPLMSISGLAVIVDGAQFVLSNALRGFGETWWPTIIQSLAFLVIMVPSAYWGMAVLNLGVAGLLWGIVIGCTISVLLQYVRLVLIARSVP